jgi:hypothetical protein
MGHGPDWQYEHDCRKDYKVNVWDGIEKLEHIFILVYDVISVFILVTSINYGFLSTPPKPERKLTLWLPVGGLILKELNYNKINSL